MEPSLAGNPGLRPDAIFKPDGADQPHVVIEVKLFVPGSPNQLYAREQLSTYLRASKASLGLLLTPFELVVQNGKHQEYDLKKITQKEAINLTDILGRPADDDLIHVTRPDDDLRFEKLLLAVERAKTNDEKKKTLEQLAFEVFDIHSFVKCKYRNLHTASSEIDLVCENLGSDHRTFLDEYGRYFLVECKNWSKPAGAKEIRDFLGKLDKTKTHLGVFFSKSGITGEAGGTDALREIHSAYDRVGKSVVVLTHADLLSEGDLSNVISLIDKKLDALRFDL